MAGSSTIPYPNSDRWLTYGPTLTLHGEGQRNREIDSGDWIGSPQDPDGRCTAEQVAIATPGAWVRPSCRPASRGSR